MSRKSLPAHPTDICDTISQKQSRPPSSMPRDPRALRSSKALGDALLSLLDNKPFDDITIRDIVAEAGVHYATFFRHHPTKESLFDQVAAEQIEQLIALSLPAFERAEKYESVFTLCSYVDEHRAHWNAFFKSGATRAMREKLLNISREYTNALTGGPAWPPTDLGVIYSVTTVLETLGWWLSQPVGRYSVKDVATILDRVLGALHALNDVPSDTNP